MSWSDDGKDMNSDVDEIRNEVTQNIQGKAESACDVT